MRRATIACHRQARHRRRRLCWPADRQSERPTTGPTTAPNNNWHHAPWRTPRRDRNRERARHSCGQARPGRASSSLLIRSPFPFIECQIMFGWSGLVPKFLGSGGFCPFQLARRFGSDGILKGEYARAKGRKEGRRNRLPASPLSQIGQKHDDKCGIEYRSSCLTSFGEVGVPGRRRGYGCQVAGRPKARLCRVGLQPQLGHTSMVSLRVGEQE